MVLGLWREGCREGNLGGFEVCLVAFVGLGRVCACLVAFESGLPGRFIPYVGWSGLQSPVCKGKGVLLVIMGAVFAGIWMGSNV